jgi:ribosome assembly protein RRB1
VEDVQWSPTEGTVLATAAADGSLAVWDTRAPSRPQLTVPAAHAADANVISWSRRATYMLASGGDDGALAVWDLRALAGGAGGSSAAPSSSAAAARIAAHRAPVTSVEWSPAEPSVLVTSGEDAATCVWDLAVERDPDEEAALGVGAAAAPDALPPQLMFVHAGQADVKEAHWHPQIPGLLVTTAGDGFNVWKPSNI